MPDATALHLGRWAWEMPARVCLRCQGDDAPELDYCLRFHGGWSDTCTCNSLGLLSLLMGVAPLVFPSFGFWTPVPPILLSIFVRLLALASCGVRFALEGFTVLGLSCFATVASVPFGTFFTPNLSWDRKMLATDAWTTFLCLLGSFLPVALLVFSVPFLLVRVLAFLIPRFWSLSFLRSFLRCLASSDSFFGWLCFGRNGEGILKTDSFGTKRAP